MSFLSTSSSLSLLSASSYFPSVLPEVELLSPPFSLPSSPYGELNFLSLRGSVSSLSSVNSNNFTFLPLLYSEFNALEILYDTCNGKQWKWITATISSPAVGAVWNFSTSSSSYSHHPCEENWQGITCSCYYAVNDTLVYSSLYSSSPSSVLRAKEKKESSFGKYRLSNEAASSSSSYYYYSPSEEDADTSVAGSSPSSSGRPEIYCTITGLSLINMNLIGTVPASFSSLRNLTALHLNHNALRNTNILNLITSTMKKLEVLSLSYNHFGGSIPSEIKELTEIAFLNLEKNVFVGSIPVELLELLTSNLRVLQLGNNMLSGQFPDFPHDMISSLSSLSAGASLSSSDFIASSASTTSSFIDCSLEWFIINNNQFRGGFPSGLDRFLSVFCKNLTIFNIGFNAFTGSAGAPLVSLLNGNSLNTQLEVYQINSNRFSGMIIPSTLDYQGGGVTTINRQLKYLFLQNNHFTGSIPSSFYYYPSLLQLYLNNNQLASSLVNQHFCEGNWKNLLIFSVSNNRLTGELTDSCLAKLAQLREIKLSTNHFSSTFPSSLLNGVIPDIQKIFLMNNAFYGSLPSAVAYSKLRKLDTFYLSNNHLTGTLPLTLWNITSLSTIAIQQNHFSGPIIAFSPSSLIRSSIRWKKSSLSIIDLTSNHFTGTLPEELFLLPKLTNLFVVRSCLSQELPNSLRVCSSNKLLQRLSLDGMNSNCQSTINSQFFQDLEDYKCLFSSFPRLSLLHLSSLSFKGTLPFNVSSSLVDLAISQNYLTGSIPISYQRDKFWLKLDLSYNKLSGKLYETEAEDNDISSGTLSLGFNRNMSLSLQANRLSGTVPSAYASLKNINVLSGNFFTCSYQQDDLPTYDPTTPLYSCGTNRLNIMLFIWIGYLFLSLLFFSWFSGKQSNINLPVTYRTQLLESIKGYFRFEHSETIVKLSPITNIFLRGVTCLRWSVILTIGYFGFFFVFIYSILSSFFRSYYLTYAFLLSSGFLSGLFPGVFLLLLWSLYMVFTYYGIVYFFKKMIIQEIEEVLLSHQPVSIENRVGTARGSEQIPDDSGSPGYVSRSSKKFGNLAARKPPFLFKWKSSAFLVFLFLLFLAVGSLIVGLVFVNIGFLYSQSHFSSVYSSLCQIALAFFKIYFTRYITPTFIFLPFWVLEKKVPLSLSVEAYFYSLHYSDYQKKKLRKEKIKFFRIRVELLLSIFLVLITPIIATMIFEINCYRGIFFPASTVTSNYSHEVCLVESVNPLTSSVACVTKGIVVYISSFQPSFRYNYQCSTSLILSYVNVFVMMVIVETFIKPTARESLAWLAHQIKEIREKGEMSSGPSGTIVDVNGSEVISVPNDLETAGDKEEKNKKGPEQPFVTAYHSSSVWNKGYQVVPVVSTTAIAASEQEEEKNEVEKEKKEKKADEALSSHSSNRSDNKRNTSKKLLLPFDDSSQLIFFINFLSVLFTFGCMFPPLAIMICFLLFVRCYEIEKGILVYYETLTGQLDILMIETEKIEQELQEEGSSQIEKEKVKEKLSVIDEESAGGQSEDRMLQRKEQQKSATHLPSVDSRLERERRELRQCLNEDQLKEEFETFNDNSYNNNSEVDSKKETRSDMLTNQLASLSLTKQQQLQLQKEELSAAKSKIYLIIHLNERKLQNFYFLLIDHLFCYIFPLHILFVAYFFFDIIGDALNHWEIALIPSIVFALFSLSMNFAVYHFYCQRSEGRSRKKAAEGRIEGFLKKLGWVGGDAALFIAGKVGKVTTVQVSPGGDSKVVDEAKGGGKRVDHSHGAADSADEVGVENEKENRAFTFTSPVIARSVIKESEKKEQSSANDQLPVCFAVSSSSVSSFQQHPNPQLYHRVGMTELQLAATSTVNILLVQLQNEEILEMLENQDEMIDLGNDVIDTIINYFSG
jgi:hypothetical protein